MAELTIEEKAQRYDEAIKKAKEWFNSEEPDSYTCIVESIFPELKENEDEKVKRILHSISSKMGSHLRDIFTEEEFQCFDAWSNAWLEKQGKNDMGISEATKKELEDNLNKALEKETSESWNKFLVEQKPVEVEAITKGLNTEFQKQVSYLIASVINGEHKYTKGFVEWIAQSLLAYAKNDLKKNSIYKPKYLDRADEIVLNSICFAIKNNIDMNKDLREYYVNFLKSLKDRVIPLPQKE